MSPRFFSDRGPIGTVSVLSPPADPELACQDRYLVDLGKSLQICNGFLHQSHRISESPHQYPCSRNVAAMSNFT